MQVLAFTALQLKFEINEVDMDYPDDPPADSIYLTIYHPQLTIFPTYNNLTINWGDGSAAQTIMDNRDWIIPH